MQYYDHKIFLIFNYLGVRAKLVTVQLLSLSQTSLAIQRVERNLYFINYLWSHKVHVYTIFPQQGSKPLTEKSDQQRGCALFRNTRQVHTNPCLIASMCTCHVFLNRCPLKPQRRKPNYLWSSPPPQQQTSLITYHTCLPFTL